MYLIITVIKAQGNVTREKIIYNLDKPHGMNFINYSE